MIENQTDKYQDAYQKALSNIQDPTDVQKKALEYGEELEKTIKNIILFNIVHPFRSNLTPEFIEENTRVIFFLYGKSHLSQFVQFLPGNAFGYLFYKIL